MCGFKSSRVSSIRSGVRDEDLAPELPVAFARRLGHRETADELSDQWQTEHQKRKRH